MDCFAVSVTAGTIAKRIVARPMLAMTLAFGIFQGGMVVAGWFVSSLFSSILAPIDHWIAFGLLAAIGVQMIREGFHPKEDTKFDPLSYKVILTLAVATSIDALAVGVSFAFLGINEYSAILPSIAIIGFVSLALSLVGLLCGILCGCHAEKLKAEFWGGIILILIGTKILIEHLFFQ